MLERIIKSKISKAVVFPLMTALTIYSASCGKGSKVPSRTGFPSATTETASHSDGVKREVYIVKRGDNLWKIAKKNKKDLRTLIAINPHIYDPHFIEKGAKIILPNADDVAVLAYTVRRGDTLWDVAERYGANLEEVSELNGVPLEKLAVIEPGQNYKVPVKKIPAPTRNRRVVAVLSPRQVSVEEVLEGGEPDVSGEPPTPRYSPSASTDSVSGTHSSTSTEVGSVETITTPGGRVAYRMNVEAGDDGRVLLGLDVLDEDDSFSEDSTATVSVEEQERRRQVYQRWLTNYNSRDILNEEQKQVIRESPAVSVSVFIKTGDTDNYYLFKGDYEEYLATQSDFRGDNRIYKCDVNGWRAYCDDAGIVVASVPGLINNGDFAYIGNDFNSQLGLFRGYDPNSHSEGEVSFAPGRSESLEVVVRPDEE